MLSYKELLRICIEALNIFSPDDQSVEEFIKDFLKRRPGLNDDDHTFIVEVLSGCFEFRKVIKVVVDGFHVLDGRNSLASDTNLFNVLCYLILFRLDELGMSHMKKFIQSQDVNKMYKFLRFFLSEANLDTWIYSEWCKEYDSQYVQEKIMLPLIRWKPQLDEHVEYLRAVVENRIPLKKTDVPLTNPQPFNITKPKPRGVPMPDKIPKLTRHKPVPEHLYRQPKEIENLARIREENRQKAEEFLLETESDQFKCANAEKSTRANMVMNRIREEEEAKLNFNKRHSQPIPKSMTQNRPIKMNAAAILREGALFRKKEGEELVKLEKLLDGAKDASEFESWQQKKLEKDRKQKETDLERKRMQGKLSREEAIIARQRKAKENQEKVTEMKMETAEMMQEFLTLRMEEEDQMRSLVEEIMAGHENTKIVKERLKEYKRKLVQDVNAQSRELMKQALEDAEAEMRRKIELIQEIRAMESIPINRNKLVDLTATAGHALLSEMSIVELRERLSLLKEEKKAVEEQRRDANIQEKQAKNDRLMENLACISVHRREMTKAAAMKAKQQSELADRQKRDLESDENLQKLKKQLEDKKAERLKLSRELEVKPTPSSATRTRKLLKERKQQETTRWRQLESSQMRLAKLRAGNLSSVPTRDKSNRGTAIIT
ncbi:cilia- and flagella-associated protein 99-like [Styela clava]